MKHDKSSAEFFENKYQHNRDPWRFLTAEYEINRYKTIINALSHRRFKFVFEPGCSIGILTQKLAQLADDVLAIDFSLSATLEAKKKCAELPNVCIENLSFDLIVFSEIGYYYDEEDLRIILTSLLNQSAPNATFLASHWLGFSEDHVLRGHDVHKIIGSIPGLTLEYHEQNPGFQLDRWSIE
jgi:SAM-dependent methyltransferase